METNKGNMIDLQHYLTIMKERAILVIGDIMLDRFVYGRVERISPESPVPVLTIKNEETMLGGAGNVLSNLAGLGVRPHILTVIGDDETAATIRTLVKEHGTDESNLIIDPARPTTIKTRFLAAHQQLLRCDFEKTIPLSETIEQKLRKHAKAIIPTMQAVILSDYGKGVLSETVISTIIETARAHNIPVLVDPKKTDYSLYRGASVITPNRQELSQATGGMPVKTDEEIISAAEKLLSTASIESIVATRSEDGMTIIDRSSSTQAQQRPVHLPTKALEVFDVSGAGDTVIATIAAGLASGASLNEAATLANIAGGIVVRKVGTAAIRNKELQTALAHQNSAALNPVREAYICEGDEAREQIQRWKAQGLKVGFTNGCFDIIHYGHVNYLNRARDKCDRLVMGLNTDDSITRLKGPERPVNDEKSRAAVIGALGSIDMVVMFGSTKEEKDTPAVLIDNLRPDIFFKGGDYTIDQLPEAQIVQNYGGEVCITAVYEGHSSTAIIEKTKTGGKA